MEKDEPFIEVHQYVFKLSWNVAESRELSAEHRHAETGEAIVCDVSRLHNTGRQRGRRNRPMWPTILILQHIHSHDGEVLCSIATIIYMYPWLGK
jgi:hypothetical protein